MTYTVSTARIEGNCRYWLARGWDASRGVCVFIGLNPSTADETTDDPTIRRCVQYAKDWGYGSLLMVNLVPLRATDPKDMLAALDDMALVDLVAMTQRNVETLVGAAQAARVAIAAWGAGGARLPGPVGSVKTLFGEKLHALAVTKEGHPGHPLYLKRDLVPAPWPPLPAS